MTDKRRFGIDSTEPPIAYRVTLIDGSMLTFEGKALADGVLTVSSYNLIRMIESSPDGKEFGCVFRRLD